MTVEEEKRNINPEFIHIDKDMAEITMAQEIWPNAKVQICWWHQCKAIREHLSKAKLSTTPYNALHAHEKFLFIDMNFIPLGRPDLNKFEGGCEGGSRDSTEEEALLDYQKDLNAVYITIPATQAKLCLEDNNVPGTSTQLPKLIIKIPPLKPVTEHIAIEMDAHRHIYPLIPGYSAPMAEGIYHWAVKKMYAFCELHDLQELWAYLWENWYCPGHWDLWACSTANKIPWLRTTMLNESHWHHIKQDFLHHFHKPHLDLLVWIIVTKLGPTYLQKLKNLTSEHGQIYRDPAAWRKPFKKEWQHCEQKEITLPINPKYRPDPVCWTCTCPMQTTNCFLLCKHLVQAVELVPPDFFFEVKRNHEQPFWTHPSLVPKLGYLSNQSDDAAKIIDVDNKVPVRNELENRNESEEEDEYQVEAEAVMLPTNMTYNKCMASMAKLLRDFADALNYQQQFRDDHFLKNLE
uniref:SWIM-type domain-containing protein n=1 Tax=Moniliophthora roreri TaxID=221103 RepID=A0A0W0FLP9_MONRR